MTRQPYSPEQLVKRLLSACFEKQDIETVLSLVTDDICWTSTGCLSPVHGKQQLDSLLKNNLPLWGKYELVCPDFKEEQGRETLLVTGTFHCSLSSTGPHKVYLPCQCTVLCRQYEGKLLVHFLHLSIPAKELYKIFQHEQQQLPHGLESQTLQLLNSSIAGGMMAGYIEKGYPLYFINAPMLQYLGYTYPQFVKATNGLVTNCMHPDDREEVDRQVSAALEHAEEYEVTYRMLKRDGSSIWVLDKGRKALSADGRPVIISVCTDITQSISMQRELEEKSRLLSEQNKKLELSQRRVQFIIDNISGGLAEFRVAPYQMLYLSESMYHLLGYTREEFEREGRTLYSVYHPDDAKWVKETLLEQLHNGGNLYLEYRIVKKNGAVGWIQMEGNRITSADGVEHIIVLYNDITDLKVTELELKNLTNTIPGGVVKIDISNMRIIYANDFFYEMNRYTREAYQELVKENAFALVHSQDRQKIYDTLVSTENDTLLLEYRFQRPNQEWAWHIMTGKVYRDGSGKKLALCMVIDNTQQKNLELSLRMEKEQYRIVTELSGSTLWSYSFHEKKGPDLGLDEIHKSDQQKLKKFFNSCRLGGENLCLEFRARGKTDQPFQWYRIEAALLRDHHDHVIKAIGKLTNIQQEKQKNIELRHATQHDGMTGLYNKTFMQQAVDEVLGSHKFIRESAFLIIDVDNFKQINDKLGHLFGDTILVNIAETIRDSIPEQALAGRVGGDEFVVLLPGVKKSEALETGNRICAGIRNVYAGELEETKVSCSIGAALAPRQGRNYFTLFRNADEALYNAKKLGKNQVAFYTPAANGVPSSTTLFNEYQMDEETTLPSTEAQDDQKFINWVTQLLSSTKDLSSAVQLVLDKFCARYGLDHIFIAEHTPVDHQIEITYLRSRNAQPFLLKRYETFACPARCENATRCASDEDLIRVFSSSLPADARRELKEKAILSYTITNDQAIIGCIWAMMEDQAHEWTKKERRLLRQFANQLTPYLIKKQIANETAYQMDRALHYDKLTGLPLLSRFKSEAQKMLEQRPGDRYAVICSDINNFKYINDTYGFAAGDEVLRAFAHVLNHSSHKRSVCSARITNDKFIALVPFLDFEELQDHVYRIHNEIRAELKKKEKRITLFINTGVCEYHPSQGRITHAIDNANIARKSMKGKARDTFRIYDENLEQHLAMENDMAGHMNEALEQGEFVVYLQPKVRTSNGTLVGAEALIRWNRPSGMVYPMDFIPFFEKNGFITKLDEYVLEVVLKTERGWLDRYQRSIPISLNLSRLHGNNPDTVKEIIDLTEKYHVPSSCIEFELTESALYDDGQRLKQMMENLIDHGYSVSIDDFGSGYSSLNTIASLPANIIKLDKAFLQKDGSKSYNRIVLKHIIAMAKEMGLSIICEGVETENHVAFLKAMDCEMAQGYFYAKPMPIEQFEERYFR